MGFLFAWENFPHHATLIHNVLPRQRRRVCIFALLLDALDMLGELGNLQREFQVIVLYAYSFKDTYFRQGWSLER